MMGRVRRIGRVFVQQPLSELFRPPAGQIASLDFLRACAVLLVLGFHFSLTAYLCLGGIENTFSRLPFVRFGRLGVDLFFVLSGYFIGKLLWREMSQRGTLDLPTFLLRRGLRIWPLYYVVFAFVLVRWHGGPPSDWWANLFFLSNYFPGLDKVPGSWSLSVEEQFYLATPLLLLLGGACRVPLRCYRWILVALLFTLPVVRAAIYWNLTGDFASPVPHDLRMIHLERPFHTRADGLVMGLLLAHLEVVDQDRFKRGFLASGWTVLLSAGAFVVVCPMETLSFSGAALLFGACTWFLIAQRRRWLALLEARPFYVLSKLSYGMYLNHFYLLGVASFALSRVPGAESAPALHQAASTALFVLASAGMAVVTYCLVESPFLQLRDKLLSGRRTVPRQLFESVGPAGTGGGYGHVSDTEPATPARREASIGAGASLARVR